MEPSPPPLQRTKRYLRREEKAYEEACAAADATTHEPPPPTPKRPNIEKSIVWRHCTKQFEDGKVTGVLCNHCLKYWKYTCSAYRHIVMNHADKFSLDDMQLLQAQEAIKSGESSFDQDLNNCKQGIVQRSIAKYTTSETCSYSRKHPQCIKHDRNQALMIVMDLKPFSECELYHSLKLKT